MKKLLSLIFVAGAFTFISCGGSENKNASASDSAASAASAAKSDSMLKMSADSAHKIGVDSGKMAPDTAKKM